MSQDEKKRFKFIRWSMIGALISAIGLYYAYLNNLNQLGGSMNATYQNRIINNGDSKTIYVFLEDPSINIDDLPIVPTFDNPTKYSLKDFSLTFEAEFSNITLVPSSFVESHEDKENTWLFKYKEKVLSAYDKTHTPFSSIKVNGFNGHCVINTKASYNGIPSAFKNTIDVFFFIVPNKKHVSNTEWKKKCMEYIEESGKECFFDVYYYALKLQPEYLFDLSAGDAVVDPIAEKPTKNQENKEPINNNTVSGTIEPYDSSNNVESRSDFAQCEVTRTDSTLTYNVTFNSDNAISELYLLDSRLKHKKLQFYYEHYYSLLQNSRKQKTLQITYRYEKGKVPEIDHVSIYPQCTNDEVISIEKKKFGYVLRNKSENAILGFLHRSGTSHFVELNGGGKTRLKDLGDSPMELFMTDRKTIYERSVSFNIWKTLLFFVIGFVSILGAIMFVVNIVVFPKNLFESSFDFKKAFKETMHFDLNNLSDFDKSEISVGNEIFVCIYSILGSIGLFYCIKYFFL